MVRVAFDALGGDHGPEVVVDGARMALEGNSSMTAVLVGPREALTTLVDTFELESDRVSIVDASEGIPMDADPIAAVRARRGTTVRVAAELVSRGGADATVSAGQTAAALAAATFVMGRLPGVTRPALAVVLPALAGNVVLLDAGAGTGISTDVLAQHALAGACYSQALGVAVPRVALLNVGSEPSKGDDVRREAHEVFATLPINYVGFVEGHDLALGGAADVVVTDGFSGNVALKALEGAVAWTAARLRNQGASAPARALIRDTAHSDFAGGMLVGVKGVSVVAHGAADSAAIAAAAGLAVRAVAHDLVGRTSVALADLVSLRRSALGFGR